ncbi:hypothetical protein GPECTOR_21g697 [Gonium pectorale]|uniref:non-specific serine/threonine protein kinase n=1 Tax=Gonium pectorale TaxID=33097 RepID=A0A150GI03_GONPE|nr:hypothetical protein GPECTOR_21g697 [Gonium pectorale]|eukprot:KXZ49471.1 hypothetical protein GPECTOR_21g697 [Gonium pectorale]
MAQVPGVDAFELDVESPEDSPRAPATRTRGDGAAAPRSGRPHGRRAAHPASTQRSADERETADEPLGLRSLVQSVAAPSLPREKLPTLEALMDRLTTELAAAEPQQPAPSASSAPTALPQRPAGAGARAAGRSARQAAKPAASAPSKGSAARPSVVKVGEGSYGEAWRLACRTGDTSGRGTGVVIKVVPIEGSELYNGGQQVRTAADMLSETLLCRELSNLGADSAAAGVSASDGQHNWTRGFVRTHAVAVCRGPYPRELVRAWERWDKQHGSENDPVSSLPADQLFWVIAMEDSGTDLEKYVLADWDQLRSVLLQITLSLAVAEASLCFEHRDLHWGNVLVQPLLDATAGQNGTAGGGSAAWIVAQLRGQQLKVASHGVAATVIDFTQSRLTARAGPDSGELLAYNDMGADPELFEGTRGEVQFDTYRWMRDLVGDDWSVYCPQTNCLWLSYLAEVLAQRFGGAQAAKLGGVRLSAGQRRQLREFRKRAVAYNNCGELLADELFQGLLQE